MPKAPEQRRTSPQPGGAYVALDEDGPASIGRQPQRDRELLTYHPDRWCVIAGKVVPLCGNLKLIQGMNAVLTGKNGSVSLKHARAAMADNGWREIPLELGPLNDGRGGRTYIREVVPGRYYCHAWEVPVVPGDARVIIPDPAAYAAWLRKLVDDGHIPGPAPHVVARLISQARTSAAALARDAKVRAELQPDADVAAETLRVLEAEMRRVGASTKPTSEGAALDIME